MIRQKNGFLHEDLFHNCIFMIISDCDAHINTAHVLEDVCLVSFSGVICHSVSPQSPQMSSSRLLLHAVWAAVMLPGWVALLLFFMSLEFVSLLLPPCMGAGWQVRAWRLYRLQVHQGAFLLSGWVWKLMCLFACLASFKGIYQALGGAWMKSFTNNLQKTPRWP